MTLLAVPNVSEGRDTQRIKDLVEVVQEEHVRVLDVHSDASHNRTVLTLTGALGELVAGCTALARAASAIDMQAHDGRHPRLGGLDVCPFVPHNSGIEEAIEAARTTARRIGVEVQLPVYLYGHASKRASTRELPDLRRGGLPALADRAHGDLPPDEGPRRIDLRRGVVCVGARGPLIAFNVWLHATVTTARDIARSIRSPSLRALGVSIDDSTSQVSMNLIDPPAAGIVESFEAVRSRAGAAGADVVATEIVGLVERRFLPGPDAEVTRLLMEPGHSLEERLLALT